MGREGKGIQVLAGAVAPPTHAGATPKPLRLVLRDDILAVGGLGTNLEAVLPLGVVGEFVLTWYVDLDSCCRCHTPIIPRRHVEWLQPKCFVFN